MEGGGNKGQYFSTGLWTIKKSPDFAGLSLCVCDLA
jgi:hypothetical protein